MLTFLLSGCQAVIGDPGASDEDSNPATRPEQMGAGTCESPHVPTEGPLRLLTRDEFERTLSVVLGEHIPIQDLLLPDRELKGSSRFAGNRGRILSDQDVASVRLVADAASEVVSANLPRFLTCDVASADAACVRESLTQIARNAFRRPLTPDEIEGLLRVYALGDDPSEGMWLAANALFQSPNFIYHVELGTDGQELTQYELASRLSFFVTGQGPSEALLTAAENGELQSDESLSAITRDLFQSEPGREHTTDQLVRWIGVEIMRPKVPDAFPGLAVDAPALDALRESMRGLLHDQVYVEGSGIGDWFVGGTGSGLEDVVGADTTDTPRAGLLTHPAWLAAFSGGDGNVPTSRGKFLATELLCLDIELPTDPNFEIPPVQEDDGTLTTRQRFELHGEMPCATACHNVMDPLGYAFEHFDAMGRYQTTDNGQEIDASGRVDLDHLGLSGEFDDAAELSTLLSESEGVKACFSRGWLEQALSRGVERGEDCAIENLTRPVFESGASLEDLTVAIAVSDLFRNRTPYRSAAGSCL